jgi:Helix-turn-helix
MDQKRGPLLGAETAKYENAAPRPTGIDADAPLCDNKRTMNDANQPAPISDLLRRTIAQAVQSGRTNYKALQRETGVTRASITRFVSGERFLRLDIADKLAAFFGLELREGSSRKANGKTKKG